MKLFLILEDGKHKVERELQSNLYEYPFPEIEAIVNDMADTLAEVIEANRLAKELD